MQVRTDSERAVKSQKMVLEMLLAAGLAGGLAVGIGRVVLRLRGVYLAIATIALVEIVRVAILNLPFTGGAVGIFAIPQPFATAAGYLLPALALLALASWLCQRLEGMPLGRWDERGGRRPAKEVKP